MDEPESTEVLRTSEDPPVENTHNIGENLNHMEDTNAENQLRDMPKGSSNDNVPNGDSDVDIEQSSVTARQESFDQSHKKGLDLDVKPNIADLEAGMKRASAHVEVKIEAPDEDDESFGFDPSAFDEEEENGNEETARKVTKTHSKSKDCNTAEELAGEEISCESCGRLFQGKGPLTIHISLKAQCKEHYGERFEEMKREKVREKNRRYRNKQPQEERQRKRREEYQKNREKNLAKRKEYYQRNREKITADLREEYKREREALDAVLKQETEKDPSKALENPDDAASFLQSAEDVTRWLESDTCENCQAKCFNHEGLCKHIARSSQGCKEFYGDKYTLMKVLKKRGRLKALYQQDLDSMHSLKSFKEKLIENYNKNKDKKLHSNRVRARKLHRSKGGQRKASIYGGDFLERSEKFRMRQRLRIDNPIDGPQGQTFLENPPDLGVCLPPLENGPSSKICQASIDANDVFVLPKGTTLSGTHMYTGAIERADAFVAMSLSSDSEKVEVKYIMGKEMITLRHLQMVFHYVLSVCQCDMKTFIEDCGSPVVITDYKSRPVYRNQFTKEILAANLAFPEAPQPNCFPAKSRETVFLDISLPQSSQIHFV